MSKPDRQGEVMMSETKLKVKVVEMIGYCPRCDQPIFESQKTKLVLGQLYHAAHAPTAEKRS